jgi:hypothetical protein
MQDNPGILFPQVQQLFLEETLRHAGLGDSLHHQECALCHCNLDRNDTGEGPRIFRCAPCGVFLQCEKCCLERHSLTPLHLPSVCIRYLFLGVMLSFCLGMERPVLGADYIGLPRPCLSVGP